MCSATSRGIVSPSHKAETNSAASSHFMNPSLLPAVLPAIFFSTLPALRITAISPFRSESPKSRLILRKNSLPLPAARSAIVPPGVAAQVHLPQAKRSPSYIQPVHPEPSPFAFLVCATILLPAFGQLRRHRRGAFRARVQTHLGVAKSAKKSPASRLAPLAGYPGPV